jgi:citrate lyase subunit beta/citryl-CoA lyase
MVMTYIAGNSGEEIRSDCLVGLTITSDQGISIHIRSKVKSMYGDSIDLLCRDMLKHYRIKNAVVEVDDKGALPFTLAARLEAAIRKHLDTQEDYLLPFLPKNNYTTDKYTDRFSRLYLPGNNPKLMINAGIYGSHAIILDLEDSVAPGKKYEARFLVRNALRSVDFYGTERMVRINQLPAGLEDLAFVIPHHVNVIVIPKCEHADQINQVEMKISELQGNRKRDIWLIPVVESAAGVINAYEITRASEKISAIAIGLEDYTADIGVQRTAEGKESFFARSMVINAAKAAGIQPIDSVFSNLDDLEALAIAARESKSLGFTGMGCIHPRQIPIINHQFLPNDQEIQKAQKIVCAFEKAEKEGIGVVAIDSKMIDPPVVKRALHIINQAIRSGQIRKNWRETHEK